MARVSIDILGISELKWTGMGEFNSDDHSRDGGAWWAAVLWDRTESDTTDVT